MTDPILICKTMKSKTIVSIVWIALMLLFSCGVDTHVINTVHEDGSVTRKVIMKGEKESVFDPEMHRVPVDSTWKIEESFEVGENNDTTWVLTAGKWFSSVEEINRDYAADSGVNSVLERSAHFRKSFRWFTTVYRFSERVEGILEISLPVSEFMDREETKFFYLPEEARQNLLNGPDSIQYRQLEERTDSISEVWMWSGFVHQWIEVFYGRCGDDPRLEISREEMVDKVPLFIRQLMEDEAGGEPESDSTEEGAGIGGQEEEEDDLARVIIPVLGDDFYRTFRTEIDSAGSLVEVVIEPFFNSADYDVEIRMPGRVVASNGYAVTGSDPVAGSDPADDPDLKINQNMLWTVSSVYFLTGPYEMWVESQVSNYWAWAVTALFLAFVVTGLVLRGRRKRAQG